MLNKGTTASRDGPVWRTENNTAENGAMENKMQWLNAEIGETVEMQPNNVRRRAKKKILPVFHMPSNLVRLFHVTTHLLCSPFALCRQK